MVLLLTVNLKLSILYLLSLFNVIFEYLSLSKLLASKNLESVGVWEPIFGMLES
jgi:hypothetical protein